MPVAFVALSNSASSKAASGVLQKVVRYFCSSPRAITRLYAILELGVTHPVWEILEYYVCQYCARNSVLVNGYPVFSQYKVMIGSYSKRNFCCRRDTATSKSAEPVLPLAVAHFLHWLISHDIDLAFVRNVAALESEMLDHRRQMARTYRLRQRAKHPRSRLATATTAGLTDTDTPPPLKMTAAKKDRLRPPIKRSVPGYYARTASSSCCRTRKRCRSSGASSSNSSAACNGVAVASAAAGGGGGGGGGPLVGGAAATAAAHV